MADVQHVAQIIAATTSVKNEARQCDEGPILCCYSAAAAYTTTAASTIISIWRHIRLAPPPSHPMEAGWELPAATDADAWRPLMR